MINLIITYCLSETIIFFVFILFITMWLFCYFIISKKNNFLIHTILCFLFLLSYKLKFIKKRWFNFTKITFICTIKTFLNYNQNISKLQPKHSLFTIRKFLIYNYNQNHTICSVSEIF